MKIIFKFTLLLILSFVLSGCDIVDTLMRDDAKIAKEKESFAIGSACRQANKSIEECFEKNEKIIRSKVLEGWKEMDAYLRETEKPQDIKK